MFVAEPRGICLFGKCRVIGPRCQPEGYCPDHCKEQHTHGEEGKIVQKKVTLVAEEKI